MATKMTKSTIVKSTKPATTSAPKVSRARKSDTVESRVDAPSYELHRGARLRALRRARPSARPRRRRLARRRARPARSDSARKRRIASLARVRALSRLVLDLRQLAGALDLWLCMWEPEEQERFETAVVRAMTDANPRATRLQALSLCYVVGTPRLNVAARRLADAAVFPRSTSKRSPSPPRRCARSSTPGAACAATCSPSSCCSRATSPTRTTARPTPRSTGSTCAISSPWRARPSTRGCSARSSGASPARQIPARARGAICSASTCGCRTAAP